MSLTKSVEREMVEPVARLTKKQQRELRSARKAGIEADPRVVARLPLEWEGFEVEVRLGEVDGRIECVGLEITSDPTASSQSTLTSVKLRQLKIGDLIQRARREYRESLEMASRVDAGSGAWNPALSTAEREELVRAIKADAEARLAGLGSDAPRKVGRPQLYGREHYEQVARVYQGAMGVRPTTTVAETFSVSISAASKWVARARELDLLPPTTKGKAGPRI